MGSPGCPGEVVGERSHMPFGREGRVMPVIQLRSYVDSSAVPTLVLVDLQQEYVAPPRGLALPAAAQALEKCAEALNHARMMGFPIAFVRWIGHSPFFNAATP